MNLNVIIEISEPKPQNIIHSLIITSNNPTHVKLKIAVGNCMKLVALKGFLTLEFSGLTKMKNFHQIHIAFTLKAVK